MVNWIKLSEDFFDDPKIISAGPDAAMLYVAGLCYCSRLLTDGVIPKGAVERFTPIRPVKKNAAAIVALISVGLWSDKAETFIVRKYTDHQSTKADVEAKREAARVRMNKRRSSHEVQANKERSSREVHEPDTETDTETDKNPPTPLQGERTNPRSRGTNPRAIAAKESEAEKVEAHRQGLRVYATQRLDLDPYVFRVTAESQLEPDEAAIAIAYYDDIQQEERMKPIPINHDQINSGDVTACEVPNLKEVLRGGA